MRLFIISIGIILLISCHSEYSINKKEKANLFVSLDSCLDKINFDTISIETSDFRRIWSIAQNEKYSFKDDTSVPFIKVFFKPQSSKFYTDTFLLTDCMVMDSLNIHRMDILCSKAIQKNYYPNLKIEEWKFKNRESALSYGEAWGNYITKGYGLKSPTAIFQKDSTLFMLQSAAYMFIPEIERMLNLISQHSKILGRNY
jgi:hypothetical protein